MNIHFLFIAVLCSSIELVNVWGQEPKSSTSASADAQKKPGAPGPEHEKLARHTGVWDIQVQMGPLNYQGSATNDMTVGGRFLQIEYQARSPKDGMEGTFIVGFDPRHRRHTLIAMDSFGPYFVTSQGKQEESGKLRLLGTDDDPTMKAMGLTKEFVHLVDFRSSDEFSIEVWFIDTRTPARKEMKFMTYRFTRKK